MDQTPLPYILDDGKTYNEINEKDVICKTGASGLGKRQCTAQLTVFAVGVARVNPLLIFRGERTANHQIKKDAWDKRASVEFQPNAWCDEKVMLNWIRKEWGYY